MTAHIHVENELMGRTKWSHPYNYDPILQWAGGADPNGTVYTDRLLSWDYKKHDELCEKHFGDRGQYWSNRKPQTIEAFLRDYLDAPGLVLCVVTEHCNQSTGFPVWRLDYRKDTQP